MQSPCQIAVRFSETPPIGQKTLSFAIKKATEALFFCPAPDFSALRSSHHNRRGLCDLVTHFAEHAIFLSPEV
jgi:hypothetical protein